jgi:hypothetical protein
MYIYIFTLTQSVSPKPFTSTTLMQTIFWWIRLWYVHWTTYPLSYSGVKIKERLHKKTYNKQSDIASPNPNHNKQYKCRYNVVWVSQTGNNPGHPQTTVTPGICSKRRAYPPCRPIYTSFCLLSARRPEANLSHRRYVG